MCSFLFCDVQIKYTLHYLWHDLVQDQETYAKADDEGEHGLAGLAVALQRREQLVVRLRSTMRHVHMHT